jgi:hypothetical protein
MCAPGGSTSARLRCRRKRDVLTARRLRCVICGLNASYMSARLRRTRSGLMTRLSGPSLILDLGKHRRLLAVWYAVSRVLPRRPRHGRWGGSDSSETATTRYPGRLAAVERRRFRVGLIPSAFPRGRSDLHSRRGRFTRLRQRRECVAQKSSVDAFKEPDLAPVCASAARRRSGAGQGWRWS